MAPADPTYPLYPVACLVASCMLLLVLLTSFIRHSWNLGVAFLCFWLFLESLIVGINAIIWSDNADIKYYVYCDIATHIEEITLVVKPMSTFIITRRLYLITSLRSVHLPGLAAKRRELAIECTLGLIIPLIVAGPLYYIVQSYRFGVLGGFGCETAGDNSVLGLFIAWSWSVIFPLLSMTVYYPRVIWILYCQRRDANEFLQSDNSVSRTNYFRIFALASIDIFLTLPMGIVNIVLSISGSISNTGSFPLYGGWTAIHTDWDPVGIMAGAQLGGAQGYFSRWTSPVLAFAIFGLFGATREARASYWRAIHTVCGWVGCIPMSDTNGTGPALGTIELGERPRDSTIDLEIGGRTPEDDAESGKEGEVQVLKGALDAEKMGGSSLKCVADRDDGLVFK
ncbi:unnamed protein product [Peniophora sp. CBMAI 1063]|nr:unnamed protein product [Peniophora sp. CBMAI 1063]